MHPSITEVFHNIIKPDDRRLLEISSGAGEYALALASEFPQVEWYPSESSAKLKKLTGFFAEANVRNIQRPVRIEVGKDELPKLKFEVIFTRNTFHEMHWKECKSLMKMFAGRLREGARVMILGPFKANGQFKVPEHAQLDADLKARDPLLGIRSWEDVNNVMTKNGFELLMDLDMDNHQHMLVYQRLRFTP